MLLEQRYQTTAPKLLGKAGLDYGRLILAPQRIGLASPARSLSLRACETLPTRPHPMLTCNARPFGSYYNNNNNIKISLKIAIKLIILDQTNFYQATQ